MIATGKRPLPPEPDGFAGEHAFRYRVELTTGTLVEWQFEHDGWRFVAGLLVQDDEEHEMLGKTRAIIDSWRWAGESSLPAGPDA